MYWSAATGSVGGLVGGTATVGSSQGRLELRPSGTAHGPILDGSTPVPSLLDAGNRVDDEAYRKVSEGQGNYMAIPAFNFVGHGGGSYVKEDPPRTPTGWCILLLVLAVLLFILVATTADFFVPLTSAATVQRRNSVFDCEEGYAAWRVQWVDEKKRYCCSTQGRGCEASPFDCDAGLQWARLWTTVKQSYCCQHQGKGCSEAVGSPPFDCKADGPTEEETWPKRQKEWCCSVEGRGCQTLVAEPFDCEVGLPEFSNGWSIAKQSWCCKHKMKGCHGASAFAQPQVRPAARIGMALFDCGEELLTWSSTWQEEKKVWCCSNHGVGCPTRQQTTLPPKTSSPVPNFDCRVGLSNFRYVWGSHKKFWCCEHEGKGCEGSSATPETYDCEDGLAHWRHTWSSSKTFWCCVHQNRGCASTDAAFDCDAGFREWDTGWSLSKKAYCCKTQHRGCET